MRGTAIMLADMLPATETVARVRCHEHRLVHHFLSLHGTLLLLRRGIIVIVQPLRKFAIFTVLTQWDSNYLKGDRRESTTTLVVILLKGLLSGAFFISPPILSTHDYT